VEMSDSMYFYCIRFFSIDRIIILALNIICACLHMPFKHVAVNCTVSAQENISHIANALLRDVILDPDPNLVS
jgi:hypothetical protein